MDMEILTKLDKVFESSNICPGCGSLLGLKMVLQSLDDLKDVILVTSPGEISSMGKAGLKVSFVNSRNPVSMARGLSVARPDAKVIVYSGDVYTEATLSNLFHVRENFLYICYNNTGRVQNGRFQLTEFAKSLAHKADYTATANVAYYEDFVAKLRKAQSIRGFKFIDLLTPCPALWNYDTSNTVEIGRMATESLLWPLYEVSGGLSVTKIPPHTEPAQRYFDMLKITLDDEQMRAVQSRANKSWRSLNEGKLV
jgi:pyruvate ferredoxin oxidoreductase beta subunit